MKKIASKNGAGLVVLFSFVFKSEEAASSHLPTRNHNPISHGRETEAYPQWSEDVRQLAKTGCVEKIGGLSVVIF